MKKTELQLVVPSDYLAEATKLVKKAKKRIYLIGLTIYRHDVTTDFINELMAAAQRGVDVHVAADFLTFIKSFSGVRHVPLTYRSRLIRPITEMKKEFDKSGASFRWLGQHAGPLFMNRTHSKWLVVDDTMFSFGGINTERGAFIENVDYMFRVTDAELADIITREHIAAEKHDRAHKDTNNRREKTRFGTVLFDGSKPGRSVIYNTAIELAKEAEEILFVSQYAPTGRLARVLKQKSSRLYFNHLENVSSPLNRFIIRLGSSSQRATNLYDKKRYLHAKFMLFTYADGTRKVITGSHNFVAASSRLGTREIALATDDEKVIKQLVDFFEKNIE